MYRIRVNDTEYPARFCAARGDLLTLSVLSEQSFLEITQVFSQASTITFIYDNSQDIFDGYADLIMVNAATVGEYQISLRKG